MITELADSFPICVWMCASGTSVTHRDHTGIGIRTSQFKDAVSPRSCLSQASLRALGFQKNQR